MKKISKKLPLVASKLTERDIAALKSIYDLRCLNAAQIYQLHYSLNKNNTIVSDSYSKRKLKLFLELNIIEQVNYSNNKCAYFLTTLGVDLVRIMYNLEENILDSQRKVISRGYLRPSELKMNPRLIPHQLHLNQFFIDFKNKNKNISFKYEDAKHAKYLQDISPDSFLTVADTNFFIEMDLGTESKKLLNDKWKHYRSFLTSVDFTFSERKTVVLFVLENTPNPQQRKKIVNISISEEIIDLVGKNFDIFVGTKQEILDILKYKFIQSNIELDEYKPLTTMLEGHTDIQLRPGYSLSDYIPDAENFPYFIRHTDCYGKTTHFFIDDHRFSPFSTFSKVADFEQIYNLFYNRFRTDMSLLFLVDSEETIFEELSILNLLRPDIFFTTEENLKNSTFTKALFQIDRSGNYFSFGNSFSDRNFIKNIND